MNKRKQLAPQAAFPCKMSGRGTKCNAADVIGFSVAGTVCHESTVGLSAKFSTASAFPTLPVV